MIHVCFGLHDTNGRYSKFVGTTMLSIFENTSSEVTIHILHDDTLTDDNRDKFIQLAAHYNQHVEFHNVEKLFPDEIKFLREQLEDKIKMRFSIGAFYRLLAKKIFGGGKMIYLDADIIVNLDINELWQQDLQGYPLAAVPEIEATLNSMITNKFLLNKGIVKQDNYFCSGVILFDLDKISNDFFRDGVQFLIDNPACESPDQDILNAFFSENYLKLAQKFDAFIIGERYCKLSIQKKIYHYAGRCIELDLKDGYNRLWFEHFVKTPWFNISVIDRFGVGIRNWYDLNMNLMQIMMRISAEHNRAFVATSDDISAAKDYFNIQDDEPIIEISDANSIQELMTKMNELRGKKTFFIFYSDWNQIARFFINLGFEPGVDFVNGEYFLTREQGGKAFPEYNFIHDM